MMARAFPHLNSFTFPSPRALCQHEDIYLWAIGLPVPGLVYFLIVTELGKLADAEG